MENTINIVAGYFGVVAILFAIGYGFSIWNEYRREVERSNRKAD